MSWRDDLVGFASFRGVPFRTVEAGWEVGRRNVVNEYPLRDEPYVDDLGRRARRYEVDGHVIGDDYLQQRDALAAAFEEPGSGELVHPRYGTVWVSIDGPVRFKESASEGGIARFTVSFVEDSGNRQPSAEGDTAEALDRAAESADDASQLAFMDGLDLAGPQILADRVAQSFELDIGSLLNVARLSVDGGTLGTMLTTATSTVGGMGALLRAPLSLVTTLRGLYASVAVGLRTGAGSTPGLAIVSNARPNTGPAAAALSGLRQLNVAARASLAPANALRAAALQSSVAPPTTSRTVLNDAVRADLTRRLAITAQARVLAVAITDEAVATADQATAWRDQVLEQIDTELEQADPAPAVARALTRLRVAVVQDVAVRVERLRQRSTFASVAVLPALALAHRIYIDAGRADELVARNAVRHPAFVPAGTLEILQ